MLTLLSPAKALDLSAYSNNLDATQLYLKKDIKKLISLAKRLKFEEIQKMMHLSDKLTVLNFERFQEMDQEFTTKNSYQAAMIFNGDVYKGLSARELNNEDLEFAQENLAILSGLYGIIKPLDLIQPYRLEMGTKIETARGKNLYQFWGTKISEFIDQQLETHQSKTVVNLASNEYFKAVDKKSLKANLITCVFEDWKIDPNEGKTIGALAKHARGVMARYIIENRIEKPEDLIHFNLNRYAFIQDRSTDQKYIFSRQFISVKK